MAERIRKLTNSEAELLTLLNGEDNTERNEA